MTCQVVVLGYVRPAAGGNQPVCYLLIQMADCSCVTSWIMHVLVDTSRWQLLFSIGAALYSIPCDPGLYGASPSQLYSALPQPADMYMI